MRKTTEAMEKNKMLNKNYKNVSEETAGLHLNFLLEMPTTYSSKNISIYEKR